MTRYQLQDCDVFYISFDEPNSEANWQRVIDQHPTAKRVHGVLGFDKAHRTCALASNTPRFITIDGDNWLHDGALNASIDDSGVEDACFSFKSTNSINGLEYGNGGLKIWDSATLLASNTHERSDSTDFCWDIRYYQVDRVCSTAVINTSRFQAWRAGYREGVKMSYVAGKPLDDFARDWRSIWRGNLSRLAIWCTVGRDVENGIWAMLGARQGLYELASKQWPNTVINDYLWFAERWEDICWIDPDITARRYAEKLDKICDWPIPELDPWISKWLKMVYVNPPREGLMR